VGSTGFNLFLLPAQRKHEQRIVKWDSVRGACLIERPVRGGQVTARLDTVAAAVPPVPRA